ncbi:MinD superfamily P-loop ATPase, contains an inserted ferredoxin domain [Bacteroides luti]|uniref:MinD superfamily P-loop ATPase, contains an inserted ferredoxin domain n=1 Tax=Bacteroides luti TaxID=1297750 RepID=A0A1M4SD50_9BACE|nr:ATP-binding protein [Bacteroides luti]SHE30163.1 MinD superfamily P-loop ATPase, contains an inserted ferredoxin domain [Bacteroides luti]
MEIAVISGKGGTGKSSISSAFVSVAKSAVVVDCDVDASNLYLLFSPLCKEEEVFVSGSHAVVNNDKCTNCNTCIDLCRFDAISKIDGKIRISESACDGCYLCSRVCPVQAIKMIPADKSRMYAGTFRYGDMVYGRLAPGEENSGKMVNLLREKAKRYVEDYGYDTIILDGPPGIGCPVISTITGVDKVVVVTEPTLSGFLDMKRVIEVVCRFSVQISVIVNKYDLNPDICEQIDKWCDEMEIPVVAHLPFDVQIVEAMIAGKTIIEYNKDCEVSRLIENAYNTIYAF